MILIFILLLIDTSSEKQMPRYNPDDLISTINNGSYSWKAKLNFPQNANIDAVLHLMGTTFKDEYLAFIDKITYAMEPGENLPLEFDSREKWIKCHSLSEIKEQGACASCWAVSAVAVMTDRYCIFSNQTEFFHFSADDLLSCSINYGCSVGGYTSLSWLYWGFNGIVSGGEYNSSQGCKPYQLPPCDFNKDCNHTSSLPVCLQECTQRFGGDYKQNRRSAKRIYSIDGDEQQIQMEILKNGPVQATLQVFSDFLFYGTGVYRHVLGDHFGSHAIKLLGWGVENEVKYWLATNSWGKRWGDRGYFKIVRGENHCKIETLVLAGEPRVEPRMSRNNIRLNLFNKVKLQIDWSVR